MSLCDPCPACIYIFYRCFIACFVEVVSFVFILGLEKES